MLYKIAIAFGSMVILDFMWAKYTSYCASKDAMKAGVTAFVILALGAFVVLTYVDDHLMLIPACAGAFVGTYIAVKTA